MDMEVHANHMLDFAPLSCSKALGRSEKPRHMLLADLFRWVLTTFDGRKALQDHKSHQFQNLIINKGSEVDERHLQQYSIAWSLLTSQLLMHHLVTDACLLM